jgi:hypothetical protein
LAVLLMFQMHILLPSSGLTMKAAYASKISYHKH